MEPGCEVEDRRQSSCESKQTGEIGGRTLSPSSRDGRRAPTTVGTGDLATVGVTAPDALTRFLNVGTVCGVSAERPEGTGSAAEAWLEEG